MSPILFNLHSDETLFAELLQQLQAEEGILEQRQFPDGESYLRIHNDCDSKQVIILCNLINPNNKVLELIFLSDTLRELGALKIGLVTPYLAYMRQDIRFHPGECVSSRPFAKLISDHLDWLITIDPHLHRYHSLDQIYHIPSTVLSASTLIAQWINDNIPTPLLIGPDEESEQWVASVAKEAGAPYQILTKTRHGDLDVEVTLPDIDQWHGYQPVLVDDIISSGRTLMETLQHLPTTVFSQPVCIGVHGLFAIDAFEQLSKRSQVVTTQTVPHISNKISIASLLADAIKSYL